MCTRWVCVYAPNIYLDPMNGPCDTIYKNVKFPMFHVISSRDEAYIVAVIVTNLCHRYSTIKVLDTRRDMSHVYTMYYGKHKQFFLLTRAQIKIEPATMTNIECGETVVADLHNISSESKTEMFKKKWTTKLLKFQSSRLVQQLLSVIFKGLLYSFMMGSPQNWYTYWRTCLINGEAFFVCSHFFTINVKY